MNRMNFGCGSIQPEGWINLDREDHGQQHVVDVLDGLPFEDGHFEYIVANHSLQQIPWNDLPKALAEFRRVLNPEGAFRILVPDIVSGYRAYLRGDLAWFPNGEQTVAERFCTWLTWYGTNVTPLTLEALDTLLTAAGMKAWLFYSDKGREAREIWPGIFDLDDRGAESLTLLATPTT